MIKGDIEKRRLFDHTTCFIPNIGDFYDNDIRPCNIDLIEKIGEKGNEGIIYKVEIYQKIFAMKIFPITHKFAESKIKQEIDFSTQASSLVELQEEDVFFPYIIGSGKCDNFIFPKDELDKENQSKEFVKISYVANILTNIDTDYFNYENLARKHHIDLKIGFDLPAYYMIYELARTDLKYWIIREYNHDLMMIFLKQILYAIYSLNSEFILHGDLHIQNILIVNRGQGCESLPVIHDFGDSRMINDDADYYSDYYVFMNNLLGRLKRIDEKMYQLVYLMHKNALNDFELVEEKSEFMIFIIKKYL